MSDSAEIVELPARGSGPFPGARAAPTKKRERMSEDDVLAIIGRELRDAVGQDGDELSTQRATALSYYEGKPLGTERPGHSSIVSRNVMEAVEWVLPALLRIFVASDQIAVVEATKPGEAEEQAAETATQYITQIFYRDNDGFSVLHDAFKDGLLSKIGWVKRWWQVKTRQEAWSGSGLTPQEYQAKIAELTAKGGSVEVLESKQYVDPVEGPLHDCDLTITYEESRVVLENVPPEEILFSPKCRRGYMPFVCHRRARTFSDLLAEGYDEDSIRDCLGTGFMGSDEALRRQEPLVSSLFDDPLDESMRQVWCEESYLLMDYDQNGIAELCKVMTVNDGQRVLLKKDGKIDVEPVPEIPLTWFCPIPMPHTLAGGHSLADLILDLQRIKSTLLRQMLDNIYLTNNPRIIVSDNAVNENTQSDILHSQPGGIIRARDAAGIVPHITPFVAASAQPLVEYLDQTQEVRTGVARHNQGLNPDDLNKTATGVSLIQQAASQRCELIARVYGRSVQELVRGILGLVRRHQQTARVIMVTGKPLTMSPGDWEEELDVVVNVGLGTGNKDQITQHLMAILQLQNGIVQLQGGPTGPLVYPQNVYAALEKMTESAGFKESFFADPSQPPPQGMQPPPEKPDPDMEKVKGQMALGQMKAQAQAEINKQKAEAQVAVSGQQAQQEIAIERDRTNSEIQLEREQLAHRMALEQRDAENRYKLEILKLQHELAIEKMRADMQQRESEAKIAQGFAAAAAPAASP